MKQPMPWDTKGIARQQYLERHFAGTFHHKKDSQDTTPEVKPVIQYTQPVQATAPEAPRGPEAMYGTPCHQIRATARAIGFASPDHILEGIDPYLAVSLAQGTDAKKGAILAHDPLDPYGTKKQNVKTDEDTLAGEIAHMLEQIPLTIKDHQLAEILRTQGYDGTDLEVLILAGKFDSTINAMRGSIYARGAGHEPYLVQRPRIASAHPPLSDRDVELFLGCSVLGTGSGGAVGVFPDNVSPPKSC